MKMKTYKKAWGLIGMGLCLLISPVSAEELSGENSADAYEFSTKELEAVLSNQQLNDANDKCWDQYQRCVRRTPRRLRLKCTGQYIFCVEFGVSSSTE